MVDDETLLGYNVPTFLSLGYQISGGKDILWGFSIDKTNLKLKMPLSSLL